MSFATYDDLIAAPRLDRHFIATSALAENTQVWGLVGSLPTTATTPGTSYSNDSAALAVFPTIASVNKYLVETLMYAASGGNAENLMLVDRLVGVSQSINTSGSKTINSTALPRYTSGENVMVFLEVSTVTATIAPVISLDSYTNQAGTGGRAGANITFPAAATNVNNWIGPMPLQAGDYGVRSVESINVSTPSGGSGAVNVVLAKPIWMCGQQPSATVNFPVSQHEHIFPQRIYDGASLWVLFRGITSANTVIGGLTVALDV